MRQEARRRWSLLGSLALHGTVFLLALRAPRRGPLEPLVFEPVERVTLPPEPAPEPEPQPKPKPKPARPRPRAATPTAPPEPQADAPPPRFELPQDQVVRGAASGVTVHVGTTRGGVPGGVPGGTGTARRGPARAGGGTGGGTGGGDRWAPASASRIASLPKVRRVPELSCPAVRELGVFGTVRLRVQVRRDGRVRRVKVLSGIGHGCDAVARKALARARFDPARDKQGRPVDFVLTYEYVFDLEP